MLRHNYRIQAGQLKAARVTIQLKEIHGKWQIFLNFKL